VIRFVQHLGETGIDRDEPADDPLVAGDVLDEGAAGGVCGG
jgi:hypothetical protein